jgi:hypothetical protein
MDTERFNQITRALPTNPQLKVRIQNALIQLQQTAR